MRIRDIKKVRVTKPVSVHVHLSEDTYKKLKVFAKSKKTTRSSVINQLVTDALK